MNKAAGINVFLDIDHFEVTYGDRFAFVAQANDTSELYQ